MLRRLLGIIPPMLLFILLTCSFAEAFEQSLHKNHFDEYFRKYSRKYFGMHFDWRYFKAQAIAESRLHPQAKSPNGALGLMQILPNTFTEVIQQNARIQGKITDPRSNIEVGIYYDKILWKLWSADRDFKDRLNFMFASYNAGKNAILRAQKIAMEKGLNPHTWPSIAITLPEVNGDGSRETVIYVDRIHKIKKRLHGTPNITRVENTADIERQE
jgi:membrane-bound lytic murein transglycosylase MltF